VPPSIHLDTRRPYNWTNGASLYDTPLDQLPQLPADYRERIMALGYKPAGHGDAAPEGETPEDRNDDGYDDSPYHEINDLALKNLAGWVPDLGLYKLRRRSGPTPSYEAVASFRPGTGGKALHQRTRNLKISGKHGIVDFGDGQRGYSPLDLVMATQRCALSEAVAWLDERVRSDAGPEVDFDALASSAADDASAEEPKDDDTDEAILRAAGVWLEGEAPPPEPLCAIERFLPIYGAGSIVAQTGCRKTFLAVDLCVAGSAETGDTNWAGRKRLRRGGSVIIELEHSQIPIRVAAARRHRRCTDERLPLMAFTEAPPILQNKKVNKKGVDWYRTVLKAAHRYFMRKFGLPLAYVQVDPLIDAAGYDNENDNAEAHKAMLVFQKLGHELNCLFIVCDHAGKDIERGARGASAKKGKDDFQIVLPEKVDDPRARRLMTAKKLRNLPDGWGVEYWFEDVQVEVADGKLVQHQAVCWGAEYGRGEAPEQPKRQQQRSNNSKLTRPQASALRVLGEVCTAKSKNRSTGVTWVALTEWFRELVNQRVIEPENSEECQKTSFWGFMSKLRDVGEIKVSGEQVCIPL
jgi:AAA domain